MRIVWREPGCLVRVALKSGGIIQEARDNHPTQQPRDMDRDMTALRGKVDDRGECRTSLLEVYARRSPCAPRRMRIDLVEFSIQKRAAEGKPGAWVICGELGCALRCRPRSFAEITPGRDRCEHLRRVSDQRGERLNRGRSLFRRRRKLNHGGVCDGRVWKARASGCREVTCTRRVVEKLERGDLVHDVAFLVRRVGARLDEEPRCGLLIPEPEPRVGLQTA